MSVLDSHDVTRPSAFVREEKAREGAEGELWRVRITGIEAAGRPSVVSRTWHVIGGFWVVDIVGGVGDLERCEVRASIRDVAVEVVVVGETGIRGWL